MSPVLPLPVLFRRSQLCNIQNITSLIGLSRSYHKPWILNQISMTILLWLCILFHRGAPSTYINTSNITTIVSINPISMCCDCLDATTEAGCSANTDCEDAICSLDPYCCDVEWDSICVLDASLDYCNNTVTSTANTSSTETVNLDTVCCECLTVSDYEPGCSANSDCQDIVCSLDYFCCDYTWDDSCVYDYAMMYCNDTHSVSHNTSLHNSSSIIFPIATFQSNATHTVFQPNSSNATWGESLECHTAHCIILCLYHYGCASVFINITNALSVDIQCLGINACNSMNAVITNTSTVTIHCANDWSCYPMRVNINGSEQVHITCSGQLSCYNSEIMVIGDEAIIVGNAYSALDGATIYGQYVESRLSVTCKGIDACFWAIVWCPFMADTHDHLCEISCLVNGACHPLIVRTDSLPTLTTNFSQSTVNQIVKCTATEGIISESNGCFDILPSPQTKYKECGEGVLHCEMYCNSTSHCKYHTLDASQALSLRLYCVDEESCAFSAILCPSTYRNASCSITCEGIDSCDSASIVVYSEQWSYDQLEVHCVAPMACSDVELLINGTNINSVSVICSGRGACWSSSWKADTERIDNAVIACNGFRSCSNAIFDFADAQNLDFYSFNATNSDPEIYCPYQVDNSCNIHAHHNDGDDRLVIVVPEDYQYGYLNINESAAAITVHCLPDHKGTLTANIEFNNITESFQCIEDGASYCCPIGERIIDNDESTESVFDYDLVDFSRYILIQEPMNQTHYVVANESMALSDHTMICNEGICVFQCIGTLSCADSTVYINGTDPFDVLVSCSSSFSCFEMALVANSSSPDLVVTVICSGTDSCSELTVNLVEFDSFNLYCVETGSCQEVVVNLDIDLSNDNQTDYGIIHCVLPSVCDDLRFNTNSERSQLMMYEFSRGIVLNNGIGYLSAIDNIECNQNRWIQFDGDLETDSTVKQSVDNEYGDDSFSCDDVTVQCGNKSCVMTYKYIGSDLVEALNDGSDTAYFVSIDDLYQITCEGECPESPTKSPTSAPSKTPTSLKVDAVQMDPDPVRKGNDYVDLYLMGISVVISLISVPSLLYQNGKIPKMTQRVDTSQWIAWIFLGLQFWDFATDIRLCDEMWTVPTVFDIESENGMVLLSAIGSTAFILISYISNLGATIWIKQILHENEAAASWFEKHLVVFVIMVMVTCGCYPSLALVSSQVFGLEVFSSGLTQLEISGLSKLQIYHSVSLRNIPHLVFQGMYASTLSDRPSNAFIFAATSTVLSVIVAISSFAINYRVSGCKVNVLQYFLVMECNHNLSEEEQQRILLHRGWRRKLSRSLTAFWKIPDDSIEIGNTSLSPKGAITHIVQSMDDETVKDYLSKLFADRSDSNVTLRQIAWQFYWNQRKEISVLFRSHFGLNEDFNVVFRRHSDSEKETKSIEIYSATTSPSNKSEEIARDSGESTKCSLEMSAETGTPSGEGCVDGDVVDDLMKMKAI